MAPTPGDVPPGDPQQTRRLAHGFFALVVLTSGLIVLGALVRAQGAGLACPDWPLCFGQFVPEMNLEVTFEWAHRVVAGSVAVAFAILAALALRDPIARRTAPLLGVAALLLIVQVLLGALTVWELLAAWTVTSHLVAGNAFNAMLLLIAIALRDARTPSRAPSPPAAPVRLLVAAPAAVMAVQLVLGGLVSSRFAGLACPEWPTCNGDAWFPSWSGAVGLHLLHRSAGYALVVLLCAAAIATRAAPRLGGLSRLSFALGLAQVGVGISNVLLALPVEVTALHSALAAALVLVLVSMQREAWRRPASSSL